ncbi:RNA polymerase factor sigma-54 [Methylocapsa sp. S129]|uniref:RNA polymerase factor sigma-54 n=1 Tax=Methylocapsa sp. S129 TaxID=1641869 RepID=UPI00131B6438|nr:RNA polymerase factor sigma-54 [Methylocapsa sp. S129]
MALSAKLVMRQGQSMVMTPQLLQAIKLLQLPNIELAAYIENELERNPLLERAEDFNPSEPGNEPSALFEGPTPPEGEADWASQELETDVAGLAQNLGTELGNAFESDRAPAPAEFCAPPEGHGLSATSWSGVASGGSDGLTPDLEAYAAAQISLGDHLARQAAIVLADPADMMIARALIDALDEAGYLTGSLGDLADRLGAPLARLETVLARLQQLEPTGVFARNLAECLSLQLIERNRFDPAMQALVANLPLLAKRDHAALRRLCGVDDEDLADMIAEIRRLEPKPGRPFGAPPEQLATADVFVALAPDNSWRIELNNEALPRVLVNESYAANVKRGRTSEADRLFLTTNLQNANWLTKSLEQRARTILKVASEIVRRQDGFFLEGVVGLRPLNLKTVADAIGMHESTVSRVTSNKYIHTPRGLFEMKYFFSTSIASNGVGEAHSAESVRFKIKQMIDAEDPSDVLSDDVIVARLKVADIVIARRTVAKYRDSLRIPSSVDRRREKMAPPVAAGSFRNSLTL